jgi:FKBP-type peptidyl-prolyl cis-trans isomerase 2
MILPGDTVTFEYTGRLIDDTVFDTTRREVAEEAGMLERQPERPFEPMTITTATGMVTLGLERVLIGMEEGDKTTAKIQPEHAYGEYDEDLVREYDVEEFEEMMQGETPEVGTVVETEAEELGTITEVDEETVTVDYNHRLAGETLFYEVEILEVE